MISFEPFKKCVSDAPLLDAAVRVLPPFRLDDANAPCLNRSAAQAFAVKSGYMPSLTSADMRGYDTPPQVHPRQRVPHLH